MKTINVRIGKNRIINNKSISFGYLLKEIEYGSPLTSDEEQGYLRGVKNNNAEAVDMLTKANICFIISMAKLMNTDKLSVDDLVNEGCIGLIKAAHNHNEAKSNGSSFLSYAVWYIQAYMINSIAMFDNFIRVPYNMYELRRKTEKLSNMFFVENSYMPSNEEIANLMEIPLVLVDRIMAVRNELVISADDNCFVYTINETMETVGVKPMDTYVSDYEYLPDSGFEKDSLIIDLKRSIDTLSEKEGHILMLYFGIKDKTFPEVNHPLDLDEIGEIFDLTTERVRQIKEKAIRRLKQSSRSKLLRKYLGN